MDTTANPFDIIGSLSALATAVIALAALFYAKAQIDGARDLQKVADAQDSFRNYLDLALQYPALADGHPAAKDEVRYKWFVINMLAALEKILDSVGEDPEWQKSIFQSLSYHREFLADPTRFSKGEFDTFDYRLRAILRDKFGCKH